MVITTRKFNEELDAGFIIDSMPKEVYFDNKESRRGRVNKKWFEEFHSYLKALIKSADIEIATTEDDPEFILGYAIINDHQLEFVYVKEAYRKQGIATMLTNAVKYEHVNEKNMTKIGRKILDQYKTKESVLTKQDQGEPVMPSQQDHIAALQVNGIPLIRVKFQSAIISGFNAAEFELSNTSGNVMRRPESMFYTQAGIIINQNNHQIIVPHSNVIQADVK